VTPIFVVTRWHQASIFLGVLAGPALGGVLLVTGAPFWLAMAGFPLGLLLPPAIVFRCFPRADAVAVGSDRLTFQRRPPLLYAEIARFNTDDYLKLTRPGRLTLMLQARGMQVKAYKALCTEFVAAIAAWRDQQLRQGVAVTLRRSDFYGSPAARVLGACLIVLCIGAGIFAEVALAHPPYGAMGALVTGLGFGILLVTKGRPGHS
jgi:hypothetical protein